MHKEIPQTLVIPSSNKSLFITVLLASLWSQTIFAEEVSRSPTPLLEELKTGKAKSVAAHNKRSFAEHEYFAKRMRMVKVNAEALLSGDPVSVSLFDDEELVLERTDLVRTEAVTSYSWSGRLISPRPPNTKSEIGNAAKTLGIPEEQLMSEFFGVNLVISEWDIDRRTGTAQPGWQERQIVIGGEAHREKLPLQEVAFYSVDGQIKIRAEGKTYRITPLEHSPKYHVFYEVDPEMYFTMPEHQDRSVRAEEAREKAAELHRHLAKFPEPAGHKVVGEIE